MHVAHGQFILLKKKSKLVTGETIFGKHKIKESFCRIQNYFDGTFSFDLKFYPIILLNSGFKSFR